MAPYRVRGEGAGERCPYTRESFPGLELTHDFPKTREGLQTTSSGGATIGQGELPGPPGRGLVYCLQTSPMADTPSSSRPSTTTVILLERCKEGDAEALDSLIARFYAPVSRIVRARMGPTLGRREEVDDIVQTTFLRVIQSFGRYEIREDAHFIAYLAKVAQSTIVSRIDYHRAQKREISRDTPLEDLQAAFSRSSFAFEPVAETASPATKAGRGEMEDIVDSCVANLETDHREVILLRDYAGADWNYVAEQLDRTVGAVQQLHKRARTKLAELVKPHL